MKANKSFFALAATAIIACGICCLPFLLPLMAGTAGISLLNLTQGEILSGFILLGITLILAILYLSRKKNVCDFPANKK